MSYQNAIVWPHASKVSSKVRIGGLLALPLIGLQAARRFPWCALYCRLLIVPPRFLPLPCSLGCSPSRCKARNQSRSQSGFEYDQHHGNQDTSTARAVSRNRLATCPDGQPWRFQDHPQSGRGWRGPHWLVETIRTNPQQESCGLLGYAEANLPAQLSPQVFQSYPPSPARGRSIGRWRIAAFWLKPAAEGPARFHGSRLRL